MQGGCSCWRLLGSLPASAPTFLNYSGASSCEQAACGLACRPCSGCHCCAHGAAARTQRPVLWVGRHAGGAGAWGGSALSLQAARPVCWSSMPRRSSAAATAQECLPPWRASCKVLVVNMLQTLEHFDADTEGKGACVLRTARGREHRAFGCAQVSRTTSCNPPCSSELNIAVAESTVTPCHSVSMH